MLIATWNINGLRARIEYLVHWLRERKPDVVGLQELKMADDQFPADQLAAEGYQAVCHGQKAWNGVAVLSKTPIEIVQKGLPEEEEFGSRMIRVRTGDIDFTTVYCPNGKHIEHPDYPAKLRWFESLATYLAEEVDHTAPAIVCGDFNICPEPIDSWNEEGFKGLIFHTDAEREVFQRIVSQGWSDLYRVLHPDDPSFSWWDYRGGAFYRNQGLRIDFLLGTEIAKGRLKEARIDRDYRKKKEGLTASDHAPVLAKI